MKLHPLDVKPVCLDEALGQFSVRAEALDTLHRTGVISQSRLVDELGELRAALCEAVLRILVREPGSSPGPADKPEAVVGESGEGAAA
jgi:hypothetical protein